MTRHRRYRMRRKTRLRLRAPAVTLFLLACLLSLDGTGVPMTPEEELRLAAAGPLANLLACCTVLLYMQTAGRYSYGGYWFACTNLLVGGANLLPLPGLDGAHILHGMFYSLDKRHRI